MSRIDKSIKVESRIMIAGGWEEGVLVWDFFFFFWDDESILGLDSSDDWTNFLIL